MNGQNICRMINPDGIYSPKKQKDGGAPSFLTLIVIICAARKGLKALRQCVNRIRDQAKTALFISEPVFFANSAYSPDISCFFE